LKYCYRRPGPENGRRRLPAFPTAACTVQRIRTPRLSSRCGRFTTTREAGGLFTTVFELWSTTTGEGIGCPDGRVSGRIGRRGGRDVSSTPAERDRHSGHPQPVSRGRAGCEGPCCSWRPNRGGCAASRRRIHWARRSSSLQRLRAISREGEWEPGIRAARRDSARPSGSRRVSNMCCGPVIVANTLVADSSRVGD